MTTKPDEVPETKFTVQIGIEHGTPNMVIYISLTMSEWLKRNFQYGSDEVKFHLVEPFKAL